jgi:hypothetical protein
MFQPPVRYNLYTPANYTYPKQVSSDTCDAVMTGYVSHHCDAANQPSRPYFLGVYSIPESVKATCQDLHPIGICTCFGLASRALRNESRMRNSSSRGFVWTCEYVNNMILQNSYSDVYQSILWISSVGFVHILTCLAPEYVQVATLL